MDESKTVGITGKVAWENIDHVVQQFMDGKTIAQVRAYVVEKYDIAERDMNRLFCGAWVGCGECPLYANYKQDDEVSYCDIIFPCSPEEYVEYL